MQRFLINHPVRVRFRTAQSLAFGNSSTSCSRCAALLALHPQFRCLRRLHTAAYWQDEVGSSAAKCLFISVKLLLLLLRGTAAACSLLLLALLLRCGG